MEVISKQLNLIEIRSHKVVKANDLIQKTRFNLSTVEQKTILYVVSKIKPDDKELLVYEFDIREYCQICGIDYDNGKNYIDIKKTLKQLRDKSIWIELEDGTETTLAWFSNVAINKRSGIVKVKIDELMKPYLLQLQEKFTQYELYYTLAMKSKYSIRLYELFKSYQNMKVKSFDIDYLKKKLVAEKYTRFSDFKSRVLDKAIQEINEYTDLKIDYVIVKQGRKYSKFNFKIEFEKDAYNRFLKGVKAQGRLDGTPLD